MSTEQIIRIISKRLAGTKLSAGENVMLEEWIAVNPEQRRKMLEELSSPASLTESYRLRSMISVEAPLAEMQRRLGIDSVSSAPKVNNWFRRKWIPLSAAASVLLIISGAIIFLKQPSHSSGQALTAETSPAPLRIENLSPGVNKAVVSTTSGDTIHLSGIESPARLTGKLADGALSIDVPRGGEFVVTLEDSTKVWLNSESRLTYPSHFDSKVRRVSLSGEAYFAVAGNPDVPFIVESGNQVVKVYGTEFNVRAYPEEELIYTTLAEGSVSLSSSQGGGEVFLSPGKQSLFNKETSDAKIIPVDIERVTGWRHGRFVFDEQSLSKIMKELSRWYDFEYEFADSETADTVFMGSIPRYSNFKTAIAILEKSGGLSFTVRDNKILISRKN